jgi:hypothetical protein
MNKKHVSLYERLPEIYRIKDAEGQPPDQLKHYIALIEEVFSAIQENIDSLYHDLFIETCDEWVIPYLADLLGTSHLKGDPWTLRADVADTIALRRRKGTLGAIEKLTYTLTQWGVHCVELRNNLVWNQHLNHQRPDEGGQLPYGSQSTAKYVKQQGVPARHRVVRGGTVTLRDPAMLSLLNRPFDPFAHIADLKPPAFGNVRYNLPNLAIFLWRLEPYQIPVSQPVLRKLTDNSTTAVGREAKYIASFYVHPMGEPVQLFNTHRFDPERDPPVVTRIDETPNPIPLARLTTKSPAGNPDEYVSVDTYDDERDSQLDKLVKTKVGLQFHLPQTFTTEGWSFRGANLCAWENGLHPPLKNREIAIDPRIGRIAMGVNTENEGKKLIEDLLLTYTYGAVGPVGAHPLSRPPAPEEWNGKSVDHRNVNYHQNKDGLQNALNIENSESPIVIEIQDSMTHELDLSKVAGTIVEDGRRNLRLNRSLIIRAADNHRPVIKLKQPLRFRPTKVVGTNKEEQTKLNANIARLTVRLEGLYLTRSEKWTDGNKPLIARAALHSLEIVDCTLDPGGSKKLDGTPSGTRTGIQPSIQLEKDYGFAEASEEAKAFNQTPEIILRRTITGPVLIDSGYNLYLTDSILDAGKGVGDDATDSFAVSSATDSVKGWGPPTQVNGITVFGRMRVESIDGSGGIWVHALEVHNNQRGCIEFSYFSGKGDRLPQNHGCVTGKKPDKEKEHHRAVLRFVSEIFGDSAYGQLAFTSDRRIREDGPQRSELRDRDRSDLNYAVTFEGDKVYKLGDQMGAFGFLLEAHKWRNLQIRYREFMPIGVRPLLIPVT